MIRLDPNRPAKTAIIIVPMRGRTEGILPIRIIKTVAATTVRKSTSRTVDIIIDITIANPLLGEAAMLSKNPELILR